MPKLRGIRFSFDRTVSFQWTPGDERPWSADRPRFWMHSNTVEGDFLGYLVGFIGFLPTAEDCRRLIIGTTMRLEDGGSERTLFETSLDILHCLSERDMSPDMVKRFLEDGDEWAALATIGTVAELLDKDRPDGFGGGVKGWYRLSKPLCLGPAGSLCVHVSVSEDVAGMLNALPQGGATSLRFFVSGQKKIEVKQ